MSTRPAQETPCWTLPHLDDNDEWRPHYETKDEANKVLWDELREAHAELAPHEKLKDERPDLLTSSPKQNPRVCLRLVCDGCGLALGRDDELVDVEDGSHFDPADVDQALLDDIGWVTYVDRTHRCSTCRRNPPDVDMARLPGPDDVPLPLDQWEHDLLHGSDQ